MIQTCQVNRSKIQSSDKTSIGIIFEGHAHVVVLKSFWQKKVVDFFFKKLVGQKVGTKVAFWLLVLSLCCLYNCNFNVTLFLEQIHQDSVHRKKTCTPQQNVVPPLKPSLS
jgi:hypothetical protein